MAPEPPSNEPTAITAPDARRGRLRACWAQFERLTQIGLPPRFPVVQFPNAPLALALLAALVASRVHGTSHSYAMAVAYLALTVWAYEELARGANWFRRALGAAFVVILIVRVAHGLQA
jgi:hypothetical protein